MVSKALYVETKTIDYYNNKKNTCVSVLDIGMFEYVGLRLLSRVIEMMYIDLNWGSSKHGKAFLAWNGWNCVVA